MARDVLKAIVAGLVGIAILLFFVWRDFCA
jgi:hypothetical protein